MICDILVPYACPGQARAPTVAECRRPPGATPVVRDTELRHQETGVAPYGTHEQAGGQGSGLSVIPLT